MRDEPAVAIDDIGKPVLADLDRRDDVPDEFEIDLGDRDAGIAPRAGERQRHIGLALAPEINRPEPRLLGHRIGEARVVRVVRARADHVHLEPRDAKLFLAGGVELRQLGDGRNLAQEAERVEAALVEGRGRPRQLGRPADLALDLADELLDLAGGALRLLALDADERGLVVLVGEPDLEGAVGEERHRHDGDEKRRILAEKAAPWRTLRLRRVGRSLRRRLPQRVGQLLLPEGGRIVA